MNGKKWKYNSVSTTTQSPRVSAQQEFQANTHSVNRADGTEENFVTNVPPIFLLEGGASSLRLG